MPKSTAVRTCAMKSQIKYTFLESTISIYFIPKNIQILVAGNFVLKSKSNINLHFSSHTPLPFHLKTQLLQNLFVSLFWILISTNL